MRIVVVAGEPIVRAGVKAALQSSGDLEVVADRADARSGFVVIDAEKPDLVVMDVALCGMNGITATREIKRRQPDTRVVLLSAEACERNVVEGFAAGADGFVLKSEPIEDLLRAFRIVGQGGRYTTPGLRGTRFAESKMIPIGEVPPVALDVLHALSPREREVLDLVLKGLRNREIAKELCVAIKTVDTHRTRINRKLGCAGAADLIRFAADNGLLRSAHIPADDAVESRTLVLLVDDDPALRGEMLREMAAQGYPPMRAASVRTALQELARAQSASLIVIDETRRAPRVRAAALLPPGSAYEPFAAALDRVTRVPNG